MSKFGVAGSARSVSTSSSIKVAAQEEDMDDEDPIDVTHFSLTAEPDVLNIQDAENVKLTAVADVPILGDVCMLIQRDGMYSLLTPASKVDEKTFECTVEFTSRDIGMIEAYCFSIGNESNLYISNTVRIPSLLNTENTNILGLEFVGSTGTVYTNVNSGVALELYAVATDGAMYDVSSPLMGTAWNADDSSIVEVTDEGKVRGLKEGTTTLTSTYNGLTVSVNVEVGTAFDSPEDVIDDPKDDPAEPTPVDPSTPKTEKTSGGGGGCSAGYGTCATILVLLLILKDAAVKQRR